MQSSEPDKAPRFCPTDPEEGIKFKLKKKQNNGFVYSFYWFLGEGAAKLFAKLSLSPNFVTWLGLAFHIACFFIFIQTKPELYPLAALAYFLGVLMDCADGKLARMTGKTSKTGDWLDINFDTWKYLLLYSSISYALSQQYGVNYLYLGFYLVSITLIYIIVGMKWDSYEFASKHKENYTQTSKLHKIAKEFYFLEGIEPLVLLVFCLIGELKLFIMLWAAGMSLLYFVMAISLYGQIKKHEKRGDIED